MNRMQKGIQILLIMVISFFMLLFPSYLHYNYVVDADFTSSDPIFQNLDDDHLLVERQDEFVVFESCDFSNIRGAFFLESLACLSFQTSALNRDTIVYRC